MCSCNHSMRKGGSREFLLLFFRVGGESTFLKVCLNDQQQGTKRPQLSAQEERRLKIQRCIQSLVHATYCREINCQLTSCAKMKRVVEHTKTCKRKTGGGCRFCQEFIHLCCYHAKRCMERPCVVPFCRHIKLKLKQQQTRQRSVQSQITTVHPPPPPADLAVPEMPGSPDVVSNQSSAELTDQVPHEQ